MERTVRVEMTISADVTITDDIVKGMQEEYPRSYTNADDEKLAKGILYASINPRIPESNDYFDDWWDGVGNMKGLIKNVTLEKHRERVQSVKGA